MRDLKVITEQRDSLQDAVSKIRNRINDVQQGRLWNDLTKEEQKSLGKLYGLMQQYRDQVKGLNFILNEDSKLDDYRWNHNYDGVDEELFAKL